MAARLWIRDASGDLREIRLDAARLGEEGLVIGRDPVADVMLHDPAVSRRHARLVHGGEGWRIEDLGSSNRTFLNGDPIEGELLAPGDHIGIGDCELQFVEEVARGPVEPTQTQVIRRLDSAAPETGVGGRAARVLGALYRLVRELRGRGDEAQRLDGAIRILVEELGSDRGALLLLDGDRLLCRTAHARGGQALRGFVLSQTIYHEVMQKREAILSRDTTVDARFADRASVVGEEIRSVLAAPIGLGEEITGILYLDRIQGEVGPFVSEDLYGAAVAAEFLGASMQERVAVGGLEEERDNLVRTIIDTHPIIGISPAVQRMRDFIRRAAPTESTVLIQGQTGTGKELVARAIHYQSHRGGHPFVAINCAAIPETLVESELFGHEKGAFTGAVELKIGRFEAAAQGTVFLDEIGDLPLACQAKLLRLLEERLFERVGGTVSVEADVRIVVATNRDLMAEVRAGNFREDLFYRLNVLEVVVPPLSQRPQDLPLLIDHVLDLLSKRVGGGRRRLTPAAHAALLRHAWPGNVRELRNVVERCVVLSRGELIDLEDLPFQEVTEAARTAGAAPWEPRAIRDVEKEHIARVLDHAGWNKSRAAEILGIERSTLYARIRSYELRPPGEGR
ncbi:MAG: sigma 54-interacting transcriptional regulator [Planctomycetota bacterium]